MGKIVCFDASSLGEKEYERLYSLCDNDRKTRANRYRNIDDKKRCVLAGILLRYAFWEKCINGVSDEKKTLSVNQPISQTNSFREVVVSKNEYGKPFIEGFDNFEFNISHSEKWVVVAYGETPIGVDVEKIRCDGELKKLAHRYFTAKERDYVFENEEDFYLRFSEIWTGKESYLKYKGVGISVPLDSVDVTELKGKGLFGTKHDEEYFLSWFTEDEKTSIRTVLLKDLFDCLIS